MNGFSCEPVRHFYPERRGRILVVGFLVEETQCRFNKCIETFLCRKIAGIARHSSPIQCSYIRCGVAWLTLHECQGTTGIILYLFEFVRIFRPRHHVEMCPNRRKSM